MIASVCGVEIAWPKHATRSGVGPSSSCSSMIGAVSMLDSNDGQMSVWQSTLTAQLIAAQGVTVNTIERLWRRIVARRRTVSAGLSRSDRLERGGYRAEKIFGDNGIVAARGWFSHDVQHERALTHETRTSGKGSWRPAAHDQ